MRQHQTPKKTFRKPMKTEGCLVATDEDFKNWQKPSEKQKKTKKTKLPSPGQVGGQASQVAIVWKTLFFLVFLVLFLFFYRFFAISANPLVRGDPLHGALLASVSTPIQLCAASSWLANAAGKKPWNR